LLPELNQYKQNNVALQKQIESLMAKLNDLKRNEKGLRNTLGAAEQRCAELENIVEQADKLAKTMQALQNTIDHLESRLEIANTERLDAEEQLSNLRDERSPLGFPLSNTYMRSDTEFGNMVCATLVGYHSTGFQILVA
jgi:chromosome segregation ATPase